METHVPRGLMTTCGAETQRLSQFVHGHRLRSFGVDEIRVVRVGASCGVGGRDTVEISGDDAIATSANTITIRHATPNDHESQLKGLIHLRYTASASASEGDGTVTYSLGGQEWEIDLSEKALRRSARRCSLTSTRAGRLSAKPPAQHPPRREPTGGGEA